METLRIDDGGDRLRVALHRPAVRNAIDEVMASELHEVCADLEEKPRILILTGSSTPERGVFASGADIGTLLGRGRDQALRGFNARLFSRIAALPMPVIAAVDGYALGGGAELAYAADIRVASDRAVFGNPETGLGIIAAAGGTWRLPRLVGEPLAKEMLLAGRRLSAQEALDVHLVASVHPPEELAAAAERVADGVAAQDPLAVQLAKRLLDAPAGAHPLVDDLAQAILFESEAKRERMTRFLDRSSTPEIPSTPERENR
ncbi:enoyl-CoA hydratase/isomerase family protein [Rathayibacter sp. VKM Ac-2929]|uniref:enoyl-CoA hydratase/isomerase family protein n=1 Tax=Rathayibacter sp. VKM Ac-2929 TaxID=2929480 RepID=UPI001FB34617|nr:enoyl-CoA hydratase/isomerase family protein [Rathayibacter sp. VKM Ac-2929]MCJ1675497.1 enoyl-CoA hydratase/isomerase family protein [Rathayibacter sp. VKM Ac-2929]